MDEETARQIVVRAVQAQLSAGAPLPDESTDLETAGLVDSMGWVEILVSIESHAGLRDFGQSWPEGWPRSVGQLIAALQAASQESGEGKPSDQVRDPESKLTNVLLAGWGYTLGSNRKEIEAVEREFNLAPGLLGKGAGIHSVRFAGNGEDGISLGRAAAEAALETAGVEAGAVDLLVATSATWLGVPSISAGLHNALLLRSDCVALDVGGACVGLINALATANALLKTSGWRTALVIASETHSRWQDLLRGHGDFAGLFGDGACALVLNSYDEARAAKGLRLGRFFWECDGSLSSLLRVGLSPGAIVELEFRGELLGKAAIAGLLRIFSRLESLSGRKIEDVDFFALHEPNPRLARIVVAKIGTPTEKVALISETAGNLGSVTCGAALCEGMNRVAGRASESRRPLIFMAAVGPGLIGAGTYLY
jgi:3-oxoacyl-[acyl-carrier-protein] synthase III